MKMRSFRYLIGEGLKNVWVNRLMSLASIGVLIACMLITGVAVVLTVNVDDYLGDLEQQNVVMVYFDESVSDKDAKALATSTIKKMDNISSVEYISKDEGLKGLLKDMSDDYSSLFNYLDGENPLPNGARVHFKKIDTTHFDKTVSALKSIKGVSTVRHQRELAKKISGIRQTVNFASIWIVALLLVIAMVIVCNTIRITMYNRKLEISIMKAVGATDSFIRFPFMVEGIALGLVAAVFTTGLLYAVYRVAITEFEKSMSGFSAIPFREFALPLLGLFCLIGVLVGLIGSRFTITKYLRKEGSEFRAI